METGVAIAIATAVASLLVAIASGAWSYKTAHDVERLRYSHDALERLSGATGTLRLQLFLSTRSFLRRLGFYAKECDPMRSEQGAVSETEYHHGALFIFRLLRPLTVSYILEQETFYADLLLEPNMVDLLRFNHAAFEMLTGDGLDKVVDSALGFEMKSCWDPDGRRGSQEQTPPFQRVRASYLRTAAAALTVPDPGHGPERRCMGHHEFLRAWEYPEDEENAKFHKALEPVKRTFDNFHPRTHPVLWLRLVGYAYVCKWFVDRVRADAARTRVGITGKRGGVRYAPVNFKLDWMLSANERSEAVRNAREWEARFGEMVEEAL